MVRPARFELAHLAALPPQDSVSTDSTTVAYKKRKSLGQKPEEGLSRLSRGTGSHKAR